MDKVEKIVVPERQVLEFYMKGGEVITRRWVSTAKKDCWNEEYKNRQKAWMKNYMANGKNTRFTPFTTRVRCAICGDSFRRFTHKGKERTYIHWRCVKGAKCHSEGVREEDLQRIVTEALGLEHFEVDRFKEEIEYLEVGAADHITVHFKDGRTLKFPWEKPPKRGTQHTKEWKEKMSKRMKERRKEHDENWKKQ